MTPTIMTEQSENTCQTVVCGACCYPDNSWPCAYCPEQHGVSDTAFVATVYWVRLAGATGLGSDGYVTSRSAR